nr:MAG TPA: Putative antitoxin of bacterial toxin-antitoxin system, YdaS/YdaT [Caudoviricetes sp.]
MPRIRQLAEQYAAEDAERAKVSFSKELDQKSLICGYRSDVKLADTLGISQPSIGRYRKRPESMQVQTMRKFVELLKPDIKTVLLFIGYSEKDIRGFVRENSA